MDITYRGVAFPLLAVMPDRRGNSDTRERIGIINRYIRLFGRETIKCSVADREFVVRDWIACLNFRQIRYYIRIKDNFIIDNPHNGKQIKTFIMFADLKMRAMQV